jgi:hypothetical protein
MELPWVGACDSIRRERSTKASWRGYHGPRGIETTGAKLRQGRRWVGDEQLHELVRLICGCRLL